MIKAVLLVASVLIVVIAIIMIANWFDKKQEIKRQVEEAKREGLEYDPVTHTYYDPDEMDRTVRKGVVSFKSKSNDR
jgi:hypothetical protein